jgi:hypothetical protein
LTAEPRRIDDPARRLSRAQEKPMANELTTVRWVQETCALVNRA